MVLLPLVLPPPGSKLVNLLAMGLSLERALKLVPNKLPPYKRYGAEQKAGCQIGYKWWFYATTALIIRYTLRFDHKTQS